MTSARLSGTRLRHSVAFTLRHDGGSPEKASLLDAITALGEIDLIEKYQDRWVPEVADFVEVDFAPLGR